MKYKESSSEESKLVVESFNKQFYKDLPFNFHGSISNAVLQITKRNQIKSYPNVNDILKNISGKRILDAGCGAGWFSNTVAYYYPLDVVGVDLCESAIERARGVSIQLNLQRKVTFHHCDLFNISPSIGKFYLVNNIGVSCITHDCKKAISNISKFVDDKGYLHIGLYHKYGRGPFLDIFKKYRNKLINNQELHKVEIEEAFEKYRELHHNMPDETFLRSWFRDQVLHIYETHHTLKELYGWLKEFTFEILSTSINQFEPIKDINDLFELEKAYYDLSIERNIKQKTYFPGFFTVLAKKI